MVVIDSVIDSVIDDRFVGKNSRISIALGHISILFEAYKHTLWGI